MWFENIVTPIARPFGALLLFLYDFLGNYGLAIILLALAIKVVLLPFQMKSKRGMVRQSRLQPKIAELQKKHGANKQKLQQEQMQLYKDEGINPASGCIWGILPMPILISMFWVIRGPITIMMGVAREVYEVLNGNLSMDPTAEELATNVFYRVGVESTENYALGEHAANYELFESAEHYELFVEQVASGGFNVQIQQSQWLNYFGIDNFIAKALELDIVQQSQVVAEHGIEYFASQLERLAYIDYGFAGLNLSIQPQWDFLWNPNWIGYSAWIVGFVIFLFPFLSAGSQFLSMRINRRVNPQMASPDGQQAKTMQMMLNFMPLMSVWFGFMMPAAFAFYWMLSSVLQTGQDFWLNKVYIKKIEAEEAVRNAEREKREAELEAKRLETERLKAEGKIEQNKNTSKRKKQKSSKQEQLEKAAEWEKKVNPEKNKPTQDEPSRIDNRRYARGRAYDPDRYPDVASDEDDAENIDDDGYDEADDNKD